MSPFSIFGICVLALVIVCGVAVKLYVKTKLNEIDGLEGTVVSSTDEVERTIRLG